MPVPADADAQYPQPRPGAPDDLERHIPYLLSRIASRWNSGQNRDLGAHGISAAALRALSVLATYGTLTVNEIAACAAVDQSSASRTVDQLVAAGLAERQIAAADQRRREIVLTGKGERMLKRLAPVMARSHDKLTRNIAPEALQACVTTLLAMMRNIEEI